MERIVGWLVSLAAVAGLGVLIHAGSGPAPRWSVRLKVGEDGRPPHVIPVIGGTRYLAVGPETLSRGRGLLFGDNLDNWLSHRHRYLPGPLEVRDALSGARLSRHESDHSWRVPLPKAASRWAVVMGRGELRWVDLHSGVERRWSFTPGWPHACEWSVSRWDDLLAVSANADTPGKPARLSVIDLNTGDVVAERAVPRAYSRLEFLRDALLVYGSDAETWHVWDIRRRAEVAQGRGGWMIAAGPDGRTLFANVPADWELWRFGERPRIAARLPWVNRVAAAGGIVACGVGGNNPWGGGIVAVGVGGKDPWGVGTATRFWDEARGEVFWEYVHPEEGEVRGVTPDGRLALFVAASSCRVLNLESRAAGPAVACHPSALVLSPDGRTLVEGDPAGVSFRDARDGAVTGRRATGALRVKACRFTDDGRLWVTTEAKENAAPEGWAGWALERMGLWRENGGSLLCFEWPSRNALFELRGVEDYHVLDEGRVVLTVHDEGRVVRGWDVPGNKPWLRIVGVPLAFGAAMLALRAWWGRRARTVGDEGPGKR